MRRHHLTLERSSGEVTRSTSDACARIRGQHAIGGHMRLLGYATAAVANDNAAGPMVALEFPHHGMTSDELQSVIGLLDDIVSTCLGEVPHHGTNTSRLRLL